MTVVLLILNLSAGERKINHRIAHLYNLGVTYDAWLHRPWREKLMEHTVGLFRSQI